MVWDSSISLFMWGHWDLVTLSNALWHSLNTALLLKTQYWFAHTIFLSRVNETSHLPGLLCDLLWSDPDKDVQGWGENDRGVSFTFGPDIVTQFNSCHGLDLICRSHRAQVNEIETKLNRAWADVCITESTQLDCRTFQLCRLDKLCTQLRNSSARQVLCCTVH